MTRYRYAPGITYCVISVQPEISKGPPDLCILLFEPRLDAKREGTKCSFPFGASDVTRTRDLLITSEMHYRLCYTSIYIYSLVIIAVKTGKVNSFSID